MGMEIMAGVGFYVAAPSWRTHTHKYVDTQEEGSSQVFTHSTAAAASALPVESSQTKVSFIYFQFIYSSHAATGERERKRQEKMAGY